MRLSYNLKNGEKDKKRFRSEEILTTDAKIRFLILLFIQIIQLFNFPNLNSMLIIIDHSNKKITVKLIIRF